MSDQDRELDNGAGASGESAIAAPQPVGSQLKAARESKEKSVGDIAMALKLGMRQVEALESGDWERLPGHTFIRGFVRNYARLLQIDPAPLLAQLDSTLRAPTQRLALSSLPHATMPYTGKSRRRDYLMAISGLLLVVIAVAVYFLLPDDLSGVRDSFRSLTAPFSSREAAPPAVEEKAPEPVFPPGSTQQEVMNPQAVTPPAAAPAEPGLVPPPVLQGPAAPPSAAPPNPSPAPAAPVAPGASTAPAAGSPLRFTLEQESWIEVRDQAGRIVFSQRAVAGSDPKVSGEPPFSLVIGNAPGVRLQWRGRAVDLSSHTQGNVARLTLE